MDKVRVGSQGFEENTMALLDSSGIRDSRDLHDDRVAFLEAVRSTSLDSNSSSSPSWNMYNATFKILRDSKSLELTMASYQILTELNKRYPRAYLVNSVGSSDLIVEKEAWSPFILGTESVNSESTNDLFDPAGFGSLVFDIAHAVNSMNFELSIEPIENMLLFQFLVDVLEEEFTPRQNMYKESSSWLLFRESLLSLLLGSRKLQFKNLIKDCISIMLKKCHHEIEKEKCEKLVHDSNSPLQFALFELEKKTFISMRKFLALVLELDSMRKEADLQGTTTRSDGVRNSALEIILDELTYNIDNLSPFLMAFSEPIWKLGIILQYFSKYCLKSSSRSTRRPNGQPNEITAAYIMNNFTNAPNAKTIAKKISSEIVQILLAHLFRACLSVQQGDHTDDTNKKIGGTILEISESFLSAFQNLRKNDKRLEITEFEKEALLTATMIANKSG